MVDAQTPPYRFKEGDYAGKAAVLVMWNDPEHIHYCWENIIKNGGPKNEYGLYMQWLITQGDNRLTAYICPWCNLRPVSFFSLLENYDGSITVGLPHTCCNNNGCRQRLLESTPLNRHAELFPFKFSVFSVLKEKKRLGRRRVAYYQKEILPLFRGVYNFTKKVRITERRADLFFKSTPAPPVVF